MPPRKLARIEPTDDWSYLRLQFEWPEQEAYEVVRPVVLFGFTPAERAQQTGLSASTIDRKATRFEQLGIRGFLEPEPGAPDSKRLLPQAIRRAIVFKATHVKAIYAALGIEHIRIDPGQPWQSYIETHFNVPWRMADCDFSQAQTWSRLKDAHKKWMADYSYQDHRAHEKRADQHDPGAVVISGGSRSAMSAMSHSKQCEVGHRLRTRLLLGPLGSKRSRWRLQWETPL